MNLVKRLLILPLIAIIPMLQMGNVNAVDRDRAISRYDSDEPRRSRQQPVIYIAPKLRNNINTRRVYKENFYDVWDALLIYIDEKSFNPVHIDESQGKIVVVKYSGSPTDIDCGAYESRRGGVSTSAVTTTYTYQLNRINKRTNSLTLDIDGSASWQLSGRSPGMARYDIKDTQCVSAGTYENRLFNNVSQTINQFKRQARSGRNEKAWKQKRRDRLGRIEARRAQGNNYRQNEVRQQREERNERVESQQRSERRQQPMREQGANRNQPIVLDNNRSARGNIAKLRKNMSQNMVTKLLGQPKRIQNDPRRRGGKILIYNNAKVFMLNGKVQSWQ